MSDNFDITQGAGKTIRALDTSGFLVQAVRTTAGHYSQNGCGVERIISANSTNAINVSPNPADLFGWDFYNTNAAVRWLKLYDLAVTPTVGTSTISMTIALKPGDHSRFILPCSFSFFTGLSMSLTTGVADSDTGAVAANEITGQLFFIE